jgi:hypothetical protein
MKRKLALLALCGLCLARAGQAASISGLSLPDTYPLAGQTLVLNGLGIRTLTVFRVKVYVAGLYVTQKSRDARAILASPGPKVVLMQFLHAASKADIEKQYREGEAKNCGHGECAASDEGDYERLIALTPGAAVGDTLTYVCTQRGLRVLFNNKQIGEIANPDLAMRILAGFIGAYPPSEDLKAHLLGAAAE